MEITRVENWLRSAPPGSRLCYHEGHLANDRQRIIWDKGGFSTEIIEPVSTIGNLMWEAYCKGQVMLFQERTETKKFRYWASKRRR